MSIKSQFGDSLYVLVTWHPKFLSVLSNIMGKFFMFYAIYIYTEPAQMWAAAQSLIPKSALSSLQKLTLYQS
jgi:hypothetical protein